MWVFTREYGMDTVSWYAELALRNRVSMSAIGSVIVMADRPFSPWFPHRTFGVVVAAGLPRRCRTSGVRGQSWSTYQELLVTPGNSPAWAISRTQIRHSPNA